jgi:hypothetical protein
VTDGAIRQRRCDSNDYYWFKPNAGCDLEYPPSPAPKPDVDAVDIGWEDMPLLARLRIFGPGTMTVSATAT